MAEQLWKGRFSKAVDSRVNDFNSSIRFDQRMIGQDMRGSGVHAVMLANQGIISKKDAEDILTGLAGIAEDLASGKLTIDPPPRMCIRLWSKPLPSAWAMQASACTRAAAATIRWRWISALPCGK